MWRGNPLTDLSREELIEAIEWLAQALAQFYTPEAVETRALGHVEQVKRGG